MEFCSENRRPVPAPLKAKPRQHIIELSASLTARVLLLNEMLRQNVRPAELERRIGATPPPRRTRPSPKVTYSLGPGLAENSPDSAHNRRVDEAGIATCDPASTAAKSQKGTSSPPSS
jgi:hypothetical protein